MSNSVILSGARTPVGKLSGVLSSFSAVQLGSIAIRESIRRSGVLGTDIDTVLMGHVLQAGQGQNPARQAAVGAGVPMSVPAMTVNKVCLSGMDALYFADLMIRTGEADIVVAGGMESMTTAPHLLAGARGGFRFGNREVLDTIVIDGLECAFDKTSMGDATERYGSEISREAQDRLAFLSHSRAASATANGTLASEIIGVGVPQRRGEPIMVNDDEGIRPETTLEGLSRLSPAFAPDGSITAGNSSQISDGAAALIVTSMDRAHELGIKPLAEIVGFGQVAGPDPSLLLQPARAIRTALYRADMRLSDMDLFEINEAFSAVTVASRDDLGIADDVLNVNGGAIALGHPIGMSGTRIVLTLAFELGRRKEEFGVAAICGGGGQGEAVLLRVES